MKKLATWLVLFLASMMIAQAIDVIDTTIDLTQTGGSGTGKSGVKLITNRNVTLKNVSFDASIGCTRGYLFDGSRTVQLANASFTGKSALFSYVLGGGTNYWVLCDADGAAYNDRYETSSIILARTNVNFSLSINNAGGTIDSQILSVESVTTENYTAVINFTIYARNEFTNATILNFTAHIDGTAYNSNITNGQLITSYTINASNLKNITLTSPRYANKTFTNYNLSTNLNTTMFNYNYTETSNATINELENSKFTINITTHAGITNVTAKLHWNGTQYETTKTNGGNNYKFNKSITAPFVTANNTRIPYYWNITLVYAADGTENTNTSSKNQTIIYYDKITETYTTPINELDQTTFTLNFTNINQEQFTVAANLYYNNTIHNATKTNNSNYTWFTYTTTFNDLINSNETRSFKWNYTFDNTYNRNTTARNQTIYKVSIQFCSVGGNTSLTFIVFNETNLASINATVESVFVYWTNNASMTKNFTYNATSSHTHKVCVYPETNIKTTAYLKYTTAFTHRYYLVNYTINATNQTHNLYNYDNTAGLSDLKGTARSTQDYSYIPNVYTALQRRYLTDNTWKTVQMDLTDDFGSFFFNIKEADTDYRIIFYNENYSLVRQTNQGKYICDTNGICELIYQIDMTGATATSPDLQIIENYNNNTEILEINWTDPTSRTSTVRVRVTRETGQDTIEICDTQVTGAAGTINCNTTGYKGPLMVQIYSSASPERAVKTWFIQKVRQLLGQALNDRQESSWWSFAIALVSVGIGIGSTIGALIMLFFALVFIYAFGILTVIDMAVLGAAAVIIIIVGLKMKDR